MSNEYKKWYLYIVFLDNFFLCIKSVFGLNKFVVLCLFFT